jgi:hypothetical protein
MTQSKITPEAKSRCAAHSMQEQLEQLRAIHAVEVSALAVRQKHDMRDVEQALDADMAWSGQHARLVMPIGGAD